MLEQTAGDHLIWPPCIYYNSFGNYVFKLIKYEGRKGDFPLLIPKNSPAEENTQFAEIITELISKFLISNDSYSGELVMFFYCKTNGSSTAPKSYSYIYNYITLQLIKNIKIE